MAIFSTIAALAVHHRRGRSRTYIRTFFDEMCFLFDYPPCFGKQLDMLELKKFFEDNYGIDFSKIKLHLENEKSFVKGAQKGERKA